MKKLEKTIIFATLSLLLLAVPASAVAVESELERRVKQLEEELKALKKDLAKEKKEQHAKGVELKKGTRFQYGGYIKANAIFSDYSDSERSNADIGDDFLVPGAVPVAGDGTASGKDGRARFDAHVKTSRFWFKTLTETDYGALRTHVELDTLSSDIGETVSNSSITRLRHAYVAWDYREDASLLVGQTWTTFFNAAVLPETVDFIGPTSGAIFARQPMIRWTRGLGDQCSLMLAAENPSSGLYDGGAGVSDNDYDDNLMPDLIARYNGKVGGFSYAAALMMREIAYDDNTLGDDDEDYGFGVSLSGKYVFGNGDDIKFMVSHGQLGRYMALQAFRDGAIEADGEIDLVDAIGGFVAYRHLWTRKLRSTVSYAVSSADLPNTVVDTTTAKVSNLNVNLIYSPVPKLSFGAEYIYATRELENGNSGSLNRFQFMTRYDF